MLFRTFSIVSLSLLTVFVPALGQNEQKVQYACLNLGFTGFQKSFSVEYSYNWKFGKSKKFELGAGGRFSAYFGQNQAFASAPPGLASSPGKSDSIYLVNSWVYMLNVAIGANYRLTKALSIGFSLDVIGISFGPSTSGNYGTNDPNTNYLPIQAKPTSFNYLLVDNNDHGSLNSYFFARYFFNEKWGATAGYQHLFIEYTTDTQVQQVPEPNDRFRLKSNMFSFGIVRKL